MTGSPENRDTPGVTFTFNQEQSRALERKGFTVFNLTGRTIATLRDESNPVYSTWHTREAFERLPSLRSQVAVKQGETFLNLSSHSILTENLDQVDRYANRIGQEVRGVTAIMGSVADYSELAFSYLKRTGEQIFGKKYTYTNFQYARTTTLAGHGDSSLAVAYGNEGLIIQMCSTTGVSYDIHASPLLVPVSVLEGNTISSRPEDYLDKLSNLGSSEVEKYLSYELQKWIDVELIPEPTPALKTLLALVEKYSLRKMLSDKLNEKLVRAFDIFARGPSSGTDYRKLNALLNIARSTRLTINLNTAKGNYIIRPTDEQFGLYFQPGDDYSNQTAVITENRPNQYEPSGYRDEEVLSVTPWEIKSLTVTAK
jgi:hypothetical protein